MSTLGDDLIQSMTEALAHAKSEGPAVVHPPNPKGKGVNSSTNPATDHNSWPGPRSR
jgi:putative transcriptional regulator